MSMEKDGYEVVTDTTPANDMKKAKRRWGTICADPSQVMVAGFNAQGNSDGDKPGLPLACGANFYED